MRRKGKKRASRLLVPLLSRIVAANALYAPYSRITPLVKAREGAIVSCSTSESPLSFRVQRACSLAPPYE
jgi:hypothetical protein